MTFAPFDIGGLQGLRLDARNRARAAVVLLHGYAMEPDDLAPMAEAMGLDAAVYLPRAPMPVIPRGRAWWPVDAGLRESAMVAGPRDFHEASPEGREDARARLRRFLGQIRSVHPGQPQVLAGFSQGGMLACDLVLQEGVRPDGLVLLSTSCIAIHEWRAAGLHHARGLEVFIAHGGDDDNVALGAGERLRDLLHDAGASVRWLRFEGGHIVPLAVWREFRRFVAALVGRHDAAHAAQVPP